MSPKFINWKNQANFEAWASRCDFYAQGSGLALVTHLAGHLELSTREVVLLFVSLICCEIAAMIFRGSKP
ncbi:MAG: hypothetical protein QM537_08610 [Candidatus Symbiobacter sp.]|nr:hypothetical protein [Candidatus Symbiobacter sp.]